MLNISSLQSKIKTLESAIASDVTPEAQKELFRNSLKKAEDQLIQEESIASTANSFLPYLDTKISPAFSNESAGGSASGKIIDISSDYKTISINVVGESPIIDSGEVKKLKFQVLEFMDNEKFELEFGNPTVKYTGKYVNAKITRAEKDEVHGMFQVVLDNPLEVINN